MAIIIYKEKQEDGHRARTISRLDAEKIKYGLEHKDSLNELERAKIDKVEAVYLGRPSQAVQPKPDSPDYDARYK